MNFQNLEYFTTVAREKNITKAAEDLGITQQALSNQISRMEAELHCKLFDRKRGFALTPSGKLFLDSANQMLDINRQTESAINDINDNKRGELKIGISHTRGQAILPLVLPEFKKMYPLVSLSVVEGSTREHEAALEKGLIDILIAYTPFMLESAVTVNLFKERLYLAAPKQLLKDQFGNYYERMKEQYNKSPELSLFKDLPFVLLKKGDRIREIADREFHVHGFSPQITIETDNIQTSFSLVAEGLGLGIYPELYLNSPYITFGNPESEMRKKVDLFRFCKEDARGTINIAIGYNEERYQSKIAKDFIKLCERKFKTIK